MIQASSYLCHAGLDPASSDIHGRKYWIPDQVRDDQKTKDEVLQIVVNFFSRNVDHYNW